MIIPYVLSLEFVCGCEAEVASRFEGTCNLFNLLVASVLVVYVGKLLVIYLLGEQVAHIRYITSSRSEEHTSDLQSQR